MRRRSLLGWVALVATIVLVAGGALPAAGDQAPDEEASYSVGAGAQKASIRRDDYGVPHIEAKKMDGVWYGTGWAQAEDRLVQLELVRRNVRGTLSELFGSFDAETIAQDEQTLTYYYTDEELEAQLAKLPKAQRNALEDFSAGINDYVESIYADAATRDAKVPLQFWVIGQLTGKEVYRPAPWKPVDSIAVGNFLAREFGGGGGNELEQLEFLQLLQDQLGAEAGYAVFNDTRWIDDPTAPTTVPDGRKEYGRGLDRSASGGGGGDAAGAGAGATRRAQPPGEVVQAGADARSRRRELLAAIGLRYDVPWRGGSNAWIVAPKKTKSGHAFLWGGPQEGFSSPSINWLVYQRGPGFAVGGFTIPGAPVVLIGQTEDFAFTTTSEQITNQQVYEEQDVDFSVDPPTYLYKGERKEMERIEHEMQVAGETAPRVFVSYRSVHGPVFQMNKEQGTAYSIKFAAWNNEWRSFVGFAEQSTADNIKEYARAVEKVATVHNFFYADTKGNIGYWGVGWVPKLKKCAGLEAPKECDPRLPHNGDGSQEWTGIEKKVGSRKAVNPKQGWIANWNTKPDPKHYQQQNGGEEYWGTIYHSEAIADAIDGKKKLSTEELTAIQENIGVIDPRENRVAASRMVPELLAAYDRVGGQGFDVPAAQMDAAIDVLRDWDYQETIGSSAMSIHVQWMEALRRNVAGGGARPGVSVATGLTFVGPGEDQDFLGAASNSFLWHLLDATEGIVPCDTLCYEGDYFAGKRDQILVGSLADAISALSGTGELPGTDGAVGFGTADPSAWGWQPVQDQDWSELDPVAATAVDLGLLTPPDLGTSATQSRSTYMQAIELDPDGIRGEYVLPPGNSGFISKAGEFSPHFTDQVQLFNDFEYTPMSL